LYKRCMLTSSIQYSFIDAWYNASYTQ